MRFPVLLFFALFMMTAPALAQTDKIDPYGPPDPTQELPLEGDALTALFMDRTHRGYYEVGDWDEVDPAFTEKMGADGSAIHDRDGVVTVGKWQTRANVVCFSYETLNGGCFRIYQRGNCYYAMSAVTLDLVAITVLDGEAPDCEPSFV